MATLAAALELVDQPLDQVAPTNFMPGHAGQEFRGSITNDRNPLPLKLRFSLRVFPSALGVGL